MELTSPMLTPQTRSPSDAVSPHSGTILSMDIDRVEESPNSPMLTLSHSIKGLKDVMMENGRSLFSLPKKLSLSTSTPSMETHIDDGKSKRTSHRTEQMHIRLLNMHKMSAGGMLTNGMIEVIEEEDLEALSSKSRKFLLQFKLMHHDCQSFEISSPR